MENSISRLKINYIFYYKISSVYFQFKLGDIIVIVIKIKGLDVIYIGLVYVNYDGNIGLIYVFFVGKVIVVYDLERYIWNVESVIGVLVVRFVDLRWQRIQMGLIKIMILMLIFW